MNAIYGLYADPHVAQRAVNNLRAAGVADADITVISSEPFEHFEFGHRDAKPPCRGSRAGGAAGLCLGYFLLGASQRSWPLVTSGMPIVPTWTNLIIIFEMTMLSAILATVVTLLVTAGSRAACAAVRPRSLRRLHPRRHSAAGGGSAAAAHGRARRRRQRPGQSH